MADCYTFGSNGDGQCGAGDPSNGDLLVEPNRVILENQEEIIIVSCGEDHTILLTEKTNNIYVFGSNRRHSFSQVLSSNETIYSPYLLDKEKEFGAIINNDDYEIVSVKAMHLSTIIILGKSSKDPFDH